VAQKAWSELQKGTRLAEKKRDASEFERVGQGLQNIRQAALEGKVQLLYIDETGMSCQPNVQRSWSPLGQPHCMDASASRRRVNVLGALDWGKKKLDYRLHEGGTCRSHFTQFLDELARGSDPQKWTFAVMDNASIHHHLDEHIREEWLLHKFVPLYLPPYSPELNPIEIIWKQAKYHWRSFKTWAKDKLLTEVRDLLDGYGTKFHVGFT
jgi:hypothetical protein